MSSNSRLSRKLYEELLNKMRSAVDDAPSLAASLEIVTEFIAAYIDLLAEASVPFTVESKALIVSRLVDQMADADARFEEHCAQNSAKELIARAAQE